MTITTVRHPRTWAALLAAPLLVLPLLGAPATATPAAPAGHSGGTTTTLKLSTVLDVVSKVEHIDGTRAYGVTVLRGEATANGTTLSLERISVYSYVNGSGPISGFLTVTWPGGSSVGLTVAGRTTASETSSTIRGRMKVIAGTGDWAGVRGTGTLTGDRPGPIGTPVTYRFTLRLRMP